MRSSCSQAHTAVTLFLRRVGERSWEWADKKRGCFSCYFEESLRCASADGTVRVRDVVSFLRDTVPENSNQKQMPWSKTEGSGALNLVVARRKATPPDLKPIDG